jgi:hypothetical protein
MYNVVWVQYKSLQLKKKEWKLKQKSNMSEWLIFALKNIASNEFSLIFFHYLMFVNYMEAVIKTFY